jgi:hypothetical protein
VVDGGIVKEEQRFSGLVDALGKVGSLPPTFQYNFPATVANASQFLGAMRQALTEYGLFVNMRNSWEQAASRNPKLTKDGFVNGYLMFAPSGMTEDTLDQYWDILAKYSDSMQAQSTAVAAS